MADSQHYATLYHAATAGYPSPAHQEHQPNHYSASSHSPRLARSALQHPYDDYSMQSGLGSYGLDSSQPPPEEQWDSKSFKSYHSQTHLNSRYEMEQVRGAPPLPSVPYQQSNYPPRSPVAYAPGSLPYSRPNVSYRDPSGGWSNAHEQLMKRRSVRQVPLREGNLVLDMPAPSGILVSGRTDDEFTHIRYSACTVDPDEFVRAKYSLRPFLYGRKTELFIVMTMYNEDEELFCKTMNAVIKNIAHLCGRSRSKTWGADGWQKVVVCVVSDGRSKINQRTLKVLTLMGVYQDGVAKDTVNGKDVQAHIFEFTTQVMVTLNGEVSQAPCPIQVIFCLKEQNKKKLNSHRWFFNAFGPLINPNVCVLLDVGTKPTGTSIYELWKCFDKHPNVGGACGEIAVDTGRGCSLLLTSPLAASQNFEYKMSNILDKPLESVFGYISVLPGAFSAYRYKALQNLPNGSGPLASYFKGETMHGGGIHGASLNTRNMYLAEDRILCFEIVTKKSESWVLKYVKSAKAVTDVPTTVPEFISQRRRWLNGSFFAALHATIHMFRIWTSGHGVWRKFVLQFEFIYNAVQMIFAWTSLANFYLAVSVFFFLVQSATIPGPDDAFNFLANGAGAKVFEIILKIYIAVLLLVLICSLGNRPQGSKWTYTFAIVAFGICNIIALWCAGFTVYLALPHTATGWSHVGKLLKNRTFRDIAISLAATYGLYFFGSIIHFEIWHLFTSFVQYLFFLPSYVNILMMYSMCKLHDLGWGTKGDNGAAKDLGGAKKVKDENGKEVMEVEVITAKEDIDKLWKASQHSLRIPAPEEKQHRDAATKQSDHDRNSRTNVVLAWIGTNMIMVIAFTSQFFNDWAAKHFTSSTGVINPYLIMLFYALAGLSVVRFTGSVLYVIFRLFGQ
ncbi:chitin synthase 2 [Cantharellus anzutake]|uniref:chitin synthase 2 n=1 Tax=Cantharellus anzutake TaxID=1750568 RepID=UPI00190645FE|nr:chitin synthase 2 [Cantharellus anzutake]KAF8326373.1 chitin synthase 2 [Cantharellus anzutake]